MKKVKETKYKCSHCGKGCNVCYENNKTKGVECSSCTPYLKVEK